MIMILYHKTIYLRERYINGVIEVLSLVLRKQNTPYLAVAFG
uniref:Uncharacterized protein n=1 Tax=Setaria italica TaxID=4555 RepID=K3XTK1_SETIT